MADSSARSEKLLAGTISGAYGIKGWVRVHALTDPLENFLAFPAWYVPGKDPRGAATFDNLHFEEGRRHGKGLIAKIEGVDDRTAAEQLRGTQIWVDADSLAPLDAGEFYWHQLVGLEVWSGPRFHSGSGEKHGRIRREETGEVEGEGEGEAAAKGAKAAASGNYERAEEATSLLLGVVDHLLATGANDVLVIAPCAGSVDQRERLIPYLPGDVVQQVDTQAGRIDVQWHPDD